MFLIQRKTNSPFGSCNAPSTAYAPVHHLHNEIDKLFDGLLGGFAHPWDDAFPRAWNRAIADTATLMPKLDIASTDKEYRVAVELPGVAPSEVKLEVKDNELVLSGEKKQEVCEGDEQKCHVTERSYGTFERAFSLPEDADVENIGACHKDGVLTITIPRKEPEKPQAKAIEIKVA